MSVYPGSLDSDSTLYVARDNIQTRLTSAQGIGDSVAIVASTTGWVANMIATIESEQQLVTGVVGSNTLNVTRAFAGTTAATHASGKTVSNFVDAIYQSAAKQAIIAIETTLGTNLSNVPSFPGYVAGNYIFAQQAPPENLSPTLKTFTFSPVPPGVNHTDVGHYLGIYNSGGIFQEAVLITGGTGNAGDPSGTIIVSSIAGTYGTGNYKIGTATGGIQEALQAAMTAGGGVAVAGGGAVVVVNGGLGIGGSDVTLTVIGKGINLAGGASINFLSGGVGNSLIGTGATPITALATSGNVITMQGCLNATISGLFLDRFGTAISAACGIDVASGTNTYLSVNDVAIFHQYIGVRTQVAPVVSSWVNIHCMNCVSDGIRFESANDEHLANIYSERNGGHGISLGSTSMSNYFPGGWRAVNVVCFDNGGDGLHIDGNAGATSNYIFISNIHCDTDAGYELYIRNTGAVTICGSEFVNGKGIWIGDMTNAINFSGVRINGSSQEGLLLTNGSTNFIGSGITITDSSLGHANTSYGLRINNSVANVNVVGLQVGQPDTTSAGGILIEVGTGSPSFIHINGTQLSSTGNMVVPISIASGLTDVFVDVGLTWINLTLQNGWTIVAQPRCRLEYNGNNIRLDGTIQAGTTTDGTLLFTLPVGYRPAQALAVSVPALNGGAVPAGTASLNIGTNGNVNLYGFGANTFIRLGSVNFSGD